VVFISSINKDNLAKRDWQESKRCCFCHKDETIKHLFLNAIFIMLCGLLYVRHHVYISLLVFLTCLEVGYVVLEKI
jgi:hypothetical protein